LAVAVLSDIDFSTLLVIVGSELADGTGGGCDAVVLFLEQLTVISPIRKIPMKITVI
jgi:hypothetical protein